MTFRKKKRAGIAARNAKKKRCPQGHPYSPENTYVSPQGGRECRTCHRERALAHFRAKHAPKWVKFAWAAGEERKPRRRSKKVADPARWHRPMAP